MIAPSLTRTATKRTSSGNTYYWEFFKDRGIPRRVHTCRRVIMLVPEQRILPSSISLDGFTRTPRPIIQLPNGEQQQLHTTGTQHRRRLKYSMASNGRALRTSAFRTNEKVADRVEGFNSQSMRQNLRATTSTERPENTCNKDWQTKTWTSHRGK